MKEKTNKSSKDSKLKTQLERYKKLWEDSPVACHSLDLLGRIIAVNKTECKLLGYKKEDMIGKLIFDFIKPDQQEMATQRFRQKIRGEKVKQDINRIYITKKGDEIYVSIFDELEKDKKGEIVGIMSTMVNDTQRREAEEEIRRLNELNQKILDNSPISIVMMDNKGKVLAANELARKLMEKPNKALIGSSLLKKKLIANNETLTSCYKYLLENREPFYYDNLPYTPNGNKAKKHLNIMAVPLINENNILEGAISMAVDNTEAIRAKENLEDLNRNLEKKVMERTRELDIINKRLSNILDLKSKFIADASHELRTPLTVIQGNLELAARETEEKSKDKPEIFDIAICEIERMGKILSDLTMLTNLDSGSDKLIHQKIDLSKSIKSVIQSLKIFAEQKNISINYKKTIPKTNIKGDPSKIEKLFMNILRNAIKYTPENGKIKISIEKKEIEAIITIKDTGFGIPDKDLPYIFERFYRVAKARASEEGSGLGLAIAKWIVDSHQGKIIAQSQEGVGSKFIVCLPYDYKNQKTNLSLF